MTRCQINYPFKISALGGPSGQSFHSVGSAISPTGPAGGVACPTYNLKPQKVDNFLSMWV